MWRILIIASVMSFTTVALVGCDCAPSVPAPRKTLKGADGKVLLDIAEWHAVEFFIPDGDCGMQEVPSASLAVRAPDGAEITEARVQLTRDFRMPHDVTLDVGFPNRGAGDYAIEGTIGGVEFRATAAVSHFEASPSPEPWRGIFCSSIQRVDDASFACNGTNTLDPDGVPTGDHRALSVSQGAVVLDFGAGTRAVAHAPRRWLLVWRPSGAVELYETDGGGTAPTQIAAGSIPGEWVTADFAPDGTAWVRTTTHLSRVEHRGAPALWVMSTPLGSDFAVGPNDVNGVLAASAHAWVLRESEGGTAACRFDLEGENLEKGPPCSGWNARLVGAGAGWMWLTEAGYLVQYELGASPVVLRRLEADTRLLLSFGNDVIPEPPRLPFAAAGNRDLALVPRRGVGEQGFDVIPLAGGPRTSPSDASSEWVASFAVGLSDDLGRGAMFLHWRR